MTHDDPKDLDKALERMESSRQQRLMAFDPSKHPVDPNSEHCNFCGAGPVEYQNVVTGPGVRICDKCVGLCVEMLEERRNERKK